jgi:uncharacterized membrane protein SirB2
VNRIVRVSIAFVVVELIFSTCGAPLERVSWLHPILPWVDGAVYLLFGIVLMVAATSRWPFIIAAAASVALLDATVGGTLGFFMAGPHRTAASFIRFFGANLLTYPVKSVLWSLFGATLAWPFRHVDAPTESA